MEQTFVTDQDNALVFVTDGDPEKCREVLLPFAGEVDANLDACGSPTLEVGVELLLDVTRQRPSLRRAPITKPGVMPGHEPVQQRRLGPMPLNCASLRNQ
jgi:hypothetical protein